MARSSKRSVPTRRRRGVQVFAAAVVVALAAAACGGGSSSSSGGGSGGDTGGKTEIVMWHGYGELAAPGEEPNYELDSLVAQVEEFEAAHPDITVTLRYVNSDVALQKLTVALQGDEAPDITYQYGTNIAQLATTPKTLDLTDRVAVPAYDWDDFFEGERAAFTVDGRVLGVPALVDNLAVVYNKDLFAAAGLPEPTADWTWDDLIAAAEKLSDAGQKQFGLEFPIDGSETEVWKYIAMLWEAGGDILTPDQTQAAFNSPAGVTALTALQQLAQAKALYLDPTPDSPKASQLFNSGKIGMFITGPWDLSNYPDVNYGVQIMPAFPGGNHDTIAGPDAWVIMDNGPEQVEAAWTFLQWLTSPEQVLQDSLATGHLPTRASVAKMPEFADFATKYPGSDVFVANLENVKKARPSLAAYPQISQALGNAITSVLLGKAEPQQALDDAASQADTILAGS